jgi:formate/nitrite transporter
MDYVKPAEVITEALQAAEKKAALSIPDMLIRGMLAGAFLGYATSLVMVVLSQGLPPIVGAILFPVGFVMLVLLGLELATGNFALLPLGLMAGQVPLSRLLRNWTWVYLGNLLGSVFYAFLFYLAVTNCGTSDGGPLAETLRVLAKKKTLGYQALGGAGWTTALVKGILCNWMVTLGTMLAFVSRSTAGKVLAMWLPILTFFAHGYEHSIVNMYVIPAGMFLGSGVSTYAWWIWNQIPVTLGNILSGALFTGMAFYLTYHGRTAAAAKPEPTPTGFPQSLAVEEPVP